MRELKKVLFVVSEDWYFCSHRLPLARKMKKDGYEIHVACRLGDKKNEIEAEGFIPHALELGRGSLSPLKALRSVCDLRSIYQDVRPDHIVNVALFPSFLGTLAGFLGTSKIITNMITGLGFVFISNSLKARIVRIVITAFLRLSSCSQKVSLIVQNQDDLRLMQSFGFKEDKNLFLIRGSGVDALKFSPAIEQKQHQKITFVGRMLWAKGVREIAEAGRILKEKKKPYQIQLVGDPDEGNPQSADQNEIDHWHAKGWITYLGRRSDIVTIYQNSDIALLPSWREGLPKSLLEAASCGLAMIATDVEGCREIVKHGENGLLVPKENALAIADAIEILMENQELRLKMGRNARKMIEDELNEDVISEKTVNLFNVLLENYLKR